MNFTNFKLPLKPRDKLTSALSTSAKIGKTIPLAIFTLAGLIFFILFAFFIWGSVAPNFWEKVNARVLDSKVIPGNSGNEPDHKLQVTYSYLFRGKEYKGTQFSRSSNSFDSINDAQSTQKKYSPGSRVTCMVNPENPQEAYLETSSPLLFLILLIPLIFVTVGAFGIQNIWQTKTVAHKASSLLKNKAGGIVTIFIFGGVFTLVGCLVFYFLTIVPFLKSEEAKSWIEVPCEILQSYVRSHDSDDGTTYSVYILYSYSFLDKTYKSDRYSFLEGSSSGYADKQAVVDRYKVGNKSRCFVNPKNYEEAVIRRETSGELWFGLLGLVFVIVGIVLPGGMLLEHKKKEKKQELMDSMDPISSGPVTLKRKQSKIGTLIFLVIFSVIWNSITWAFLVPETGLLSQRSVDIGMTLFAGIFVLAGAGVSFAVVHTILSLFNPSPVLVLDKMVIPVGGLTNLGWSIARGKRPLESLVITVTASEECMVPSTGKKGRSSKKTIPFYADELIATMDPHEIYRGDVEIEIPVTAMHSFESDSVKIIWQINVKASIPKWPDINDAYEITVIPAESIVGEEL